MKSSDNQDRIHILTEYSQKLQWEEQIRYLWKSCFGDPQHYEDFYFDKIYTNNQVYAIVDKGMIHVNFYRCKVMGQEMMLPYIVGVATDEKYRRQGVMRRLLERVLWDLHEQKVPFAYLMPANVEYYKPFGFQSVSQKREYEFLTKDIASTNRFRYVSYQDIQRLASNLRLQLLKEVNQWLEQQYDVYVVHGEEYYDLLYAEKTCQNGDVIFCFDGDIDAKHLCAMFAYAMDSEIPYIEQIVIKKQVIKGLDLMNTMCRSFFAEANRVKIVQSYPYMLKIIDRESFVDLFEEKLTDISTLPVADIVTCKEMVEYLFEKKDNIYFAEIV